LTIVINLAKYFKLNKSIATSSINDKLNPSILMNIYWLIGDKIFRLGGGLVVGILVAKYLGPEKFGIFSFSFSYVWMFSYIVTLGLDEIVLRELIKAPDLKNKLLGTALGTKFFGGIVSIFLIGISIFFIKREDNEIILITLIMAVSMIIKNVGVFRLFFEAQLNSKYNVWAENIGFIAVSMLKIYFVFIAAPLIFFVWALVFEVIISSLVFIYIYWKNGHNIYDWKYEFILAKKLLKESWPLIMSGISVMIYVKSDQVMLGLMANNYETGIYSVATKISELWYFIPVALVSSFFPSIVQSKAQGEKKYLANWQFFFNLLVYLSFGIGFFISFLSNFLILLLFGNEYADASNILRIHTWSCIFVFLGVASAKYLLIENLQKIYFYQTLIGAFCNVVFNILLIPFYGAKGAAIATLFSYGLSVFSCLFFSRSKNLGNMLLNSLNLYKNFKYDFKKICKKDNSTKISQ